MNSATDSRSYPSIITSATQPTTLVLEDTDDSYSNPNVITSRQDLSFVECWHEDCSEKGVILPLGNSQYGANTYNGITLSLLTDLGVAQGYSAFGEFDTDYSWLWCGSSEFDTSCNWIYY